jgi:hypothetical protein
VVLDRAIGLRARRVLGRSIALALVATVVIAATASAELAQKGDLFVNFNGGIKPVALPRSTPAPISVRIEGKVRVLSGATPPALREISMALNRAGRLDMTGLPVCHRGKIASLNSEEALAACGPSLVGSGGIVAQTYLPNQVPSPLRGNVLLFNGVSGGHPAILAHVYQKYPPVTYLIVFTIKHNGKGAFGTVIDGKIPPSANRNGYLTSIFLQFERRYTYRGVRRSYISANCAAPAGLNSGIFPFARVSMAFEDGRTLSSTLDRSCKVSG